jgi:hypothetical protein
MSNHDFGPLTAQYPAAIASMAPEFRAHEFILQLAQQNQRLYVEALYAYKDSPPQGTPTPFLIVHRILAQRLSDFPHLVKKYEGSVTSNDIFGNQSECSRWKRL